MHTAEGLAKKHGLEHYLDKPTELNEAIFNLMLLQETIQLEKARMARRDNTGAVAISTRRSASGSFVAVCSGDAKYRYAVETALRAGTAVVAVFLRGRFSGILRGMGVPEDRVMEFADSVTIADDTVCLDQE
jgi:hypothetical protein